MVVRDRLADLKNYGIMDTSPEEELDEMTAIATAICDTPISLITLLDDKRQWFKSKHGLAIDQTPIEQAFCRYTLSKPDEVLVIEDAKKDPRFSENPLVIEDPKIRFYAGAPLVTPLGNVLGTICVIDRVPKQISENQRKALQLLAKKTMDFLNLRKLNLEQAQTIAGNEEHLQKITEQVPGLIFQCIQTKHLEIEIPFISKSLSYIHPKLTSLILKNNPKVILDVIHPSDLCKIKQALERSFVEKHMINIDFRVVTPNQNVIWYRALAAPEEKDNDSVSWYGILQDITDNKEYEHRLEQLSFDISHVLRKPITTLQGLNHLIQKDVLDETLIKKYAGFIKIVADELDIFTRKLNETYQQKNTTLYNTHVKHSDN
ncbi:GAF domain-containing protein [Aquimarina brevivitae]|uniref:PAS domain S-box-containing protein n=1 Tax=Aquimarina brevivitae TaxID=323412 RepID=A0A4Q7P0U1_9FLAO|nr:GAF domain-containing protein [Aquimarina brevivitae]RZS93423.1 PAS domain S-box-containing protein [Aquimarina brevivitae]